MKTIIVILPLIAESNTKNLTEFPLWGSSWVVAEGENKRIYPSVLPLTPKKIIRIDFVAPTHNTKAVIKWVNYCHKDYWGTAEVIQEIGNNINKKQLHISEVNNNEGIDIAYQPFDDTLWSVNEAIIKEFENGYDYAEKIQGKEEKTYKKGSSGGLTALKTEIQDNTAYTKSKPSAWVGRPITATDKDEFTLGKWSEKDQKYFYYRQTTQDESTAKIQMTDGTVKVKSVGGFEFDIDGIREYCDENRYYKKVLEKDLVFKTENLGYWQVHIYPEIWYYPRDYTTGQPVIVDELKKTHTEALSLKKQSIDDPNNTALKYWRNPYFSDSASTVVSFAFTEDGTVLKDQKSIWLSGSAIGSKISYEHFPKKMYSVSQKQSLREALLQLYSTSEDDEEYARTLDLRCVQSTWETADEANGNIIFPPNKRKNGVYERDWTVNDGYFRYNGCPCTREAKLGNRTKAEIRHFIVYPVPTCNARDISAASAFYNLLRWHLDAPKDKDVLSGKLKEVVRIWNNKIENYKLFLGGNPSSAELNAFLNGVAKEREKICPETWVDAIKGLVGF